jgi:hypothetical protein
MTIKIAAALACGLASFAVAQTQPASEPPTAPAAPANAAAPPAYTPLRWNEDYGYLRVAPDADPWDPLKYIPLGDDDRDWYLSLGGQARYRYEWFDDFNFGAPGAQDDDGYHLGRFLGHVDAHFGPNVRGFVQFIAAGVDGREPGERPLLDENDFDFHQAFVDVRVPVGDASLTLRGGRQNLLYGAQRLISPLDWTNTRRTFDGGRASLSLSKNHTLDAFYVNPVAVDEGPIDDANDDDFAGVYDTLLLPDVLPGAASRMELYALYLDRQAGVFAQGTGHEQRYTVGGRFYTNPKPWDLDVEAAYQFGDFEEGDISAWMFATEAGYTFAHQPLKPRVYVGLDIASGDDDPADDDLQTFNQLFPLGHAFFGYIDVLGRQNVIDVHPGVELTLAEGRRGVKRLSLRTDYHLFWRYSDDDAIYNVGSAIQRGDAGSGASFIGSELDLLLNWQIDRHTAAYLGYSHFFAGDFINETGPHEDIDFLYAAVSYTF